MLGTNIWNREFVTCVDLIASLDACEKLTVTYVQMKHARIVLPSLPSAHDASTLHTKKMGNAIVMVDICMSLVSTSA